MTAGDATVPAGAFDLAEGEVSQPLSGPFGWVLIKVVQVNPGSARPIAEVHDELRAAIATERAIIEITDHLNALEDALAAADVLESVPGLVADILPARVTTFAPIDSAGNGIDGQPVPGLPDGTPFRIEAFSTNAGDTGQLNETPGHVFYVLRVDQIAPPALQRLEDRREAVLAAWMLAEQSKRLTEIAAAAEERANAGGGDIAAVAAELELEAKSADAVARDEANPDLSPALLAAVFSTPRGQWATGPGGAPGSIVLARVREVTRVEGGDPRAAELEARSAATRDIADELAEAYQDAILAASAIELNQTLFDQSRQRQP